MQPITARTGLVAEAQAMPSFAQPRRQLRQSLGTVLEKPCAHPSRRGDNIHQARLPCMRLCAGHSGTTLDILYVERRAADHSANIGSNLWPERVLVSFRCPQFGVRSLHDGFG